jgi:hypothetical protein
MPIEIRSDESKKLTIFTASGELTYGDVSDAIESFYENRPTLNVLWDLSSAITTNITTEQVHQVSEMLERLRKRREGGKTALVSPADAAYGLARMLQTLLELAGDPLPIELSVFRDRKAAMQWLCEE